MFEPLSTEVGMSNSRAPETVYEVTRWIYQPATGRCIPVEWIDADGTLHAHPHKADTTPLVVLLRERELESKLAV